MSAGGANKKTRDCIKHFYWYKNAKGSKISHYKNLIYILLSLKVATCNYETGQICLGKTAITRRIISMICMICTIFFIPQD